MSIFNEIYAEGITSDNIKNAIATFGRSLYTPNSPFDKHLRGIEVKYRYLFYQREHPTNRIRYVFKKQFVS